MTHRELALSILVEPHLDESMRLEVSSNLIPSYEAEEILKTFKLLVRCIRRYYTGEEPCLEMYDIDRMAEYSLPHTLDEFTFEPTDVVFSDEFITSLYDIVGSYICKEDMVAAIVRGRNEFMYTKPALLEFSTSVQQTSDQRHVIRIGAEYDSVKKAIRIYIELLAACIMRAAKS